MAGFGALFALVGGGIIAGGIAVGRSVRRRKALVEAHPTEPWRANPAWASGTIQDASGWTVLFLWGFAIVWNGIAWAAMFAARDDMRREKALMFLALFPLVGVLLLALAIYQTMRRLKFGRSILVMETMPGCVGGWLAGNVQTRAPIVADNGVHLALRCIRRVTTGSGKNSSTNETTLWESEQTIVGRLPQGSQGGSAIPIAFKIPEKCRVSDDSNTRDQIVWRLRLQVALPGADYAADFVVPVFDAPQTQPVGFVPHAEHTAAPIRGAEPQKSGQSDDPRIQFLRGPGNRKRFIFPAGRQVGCAVTVTIFALVFVGGGMLIYNLDGPWFIAIIAEVIAAGIAWGAMILWFREVEIAFDPRGVERNTRMLMQRGTRTTPASDVAAVTYHSDTQVNDTSYYTVQLKLKDNNTVNLVGMLLVRDAQWIASEIASTLGVPSEEKATEPGTD
jgi:hypothetical protein